MSDHLSFNCRMVCRSKGKSAVGKAAYIRGTKLTQERTNKTFNYKYKSHEVTFSKIIAPDHCPDWVFDPQELWNRVEKAEKRKDSQEARELILAFPKELSAEKKELLITSYCYENLVARGMIADINIHNIPKNPHAHVLLTTRRLLANGSFGKKEREWNKKNVLEQLRQNWDDLCNRYLEESLIKTKVSLKSFKTLKIKKIPTIHVGNSSSKDERLQINQLIKHINLLLNNDKTTFFKKINFDKEIENYISQIKKYNNGGKNEYKKLITNLEEIKASYEATTSNSAAPAA